MCDVVLVSVIINNFNYGAYVRDAIDSALAQTYPHVEVIVVDDGSTDGSREVIESYGSRIVPVLKSNAGQGSAFNAGFRASRGDVVMMLDADDTFLPEKAQTIVGVLDANPEAGWCFHQLQLVDVKRDNAPVRVEPQQPPGPRDVRDEVSRARMPRFAPPTSALCFRRPLLERIFPMPELEGTSADRYLKLMSLMLAPGYFLDRVLAVQKVHGENAFTLRPDRQRVGAKSLIHTAYWIRQKLPQAAGLSNSLFGRGLGVYRRTGGVDDKYAHVVRDYLSMASPAERLTIAMRAFYHSSPLLAWARGS